jgi:hypothetical protein
MALMENRCDIKDRMAQRLASYKERLTAQFDELFPRQLVGSRHAPDGIHLITEWINN